MKPVKRKSIVEECKNIKLIIKSNKESDNKQYWDKVNQIREKNKRKQSDNGSKKNLFDAELSK